MYIIKAVQQDGLFIEYNSNVLYINMKYLSTWQGWSLVNPDYSKTLNWQNIN